MGRAKRRAPEKLPEKLRFIRERAKLTMPEMVEKLGCEEIPLYKGDISKYEAGTREPPLVILLRYAKLGKISLEKLIDDAELCGHFVRFVDNADFIGKAC